MGMPFKLTYQKVFQLSQNDFTKMTDARIWKKEKKRWMISYPHPILWNNIYNSWIHISILTLFTDRWKCVQIEEI